MGPGLEDTLAAAGAPMDRTATAPATPRALTAALASGQRLGHFRIERPLGAGGMGEVYLATDLALDRPVAIKVLPERVAGDPTRRDRMIREARAQARISHPNVAHIYFIGEEAGLLYFAMELVAGVTLAEKIADGPLGVDEALAVIRAAALGVREAQRNGITHRDLKPSNLMIDGNGLVKVLDFGLAASALPSGARSTPGGSAVGSTAPAPTADGPVAQTSLAGTPLYMAPEQARGEAIDFRADVYALGATLYHLASGRPPFEADTADALLTLHASAARPTLPRRGQPRSQIGAIDKLCATMMAPRPEARFASYDELIHAIELASAVHTRPAGLWVRSIATLLDFGLVALVVGLLTVLVGLLDVEPAVPLLFPAVALYQAIAIQRWGRTFGKALFELEVVDVATAERPTFGRAGRRAAAMYGPPWLAAMIVDGCGWLGIQLPHDLTALADVVVVVLGGVALVHAAARVAGKRAPWDRFAGTMVRYRTARAIAR